MNFNRRKTSCERAKEMDMVDYLSSLGYKPERISGSSYWYLSPLHDEKTASFKVNRKLNRWYDFGEGAGGNLVDFGIRYFKCTVEDFLRKLSSPALVQEVTRNTGSKNSKDEAENLIKIISIKPITSLPLLRYLQQRRIPEAIAHRYCNEVIYSFKDRSYYAIGFKNNSGGYELRNERFKNCSSPKDITLINNQTGRLTVFEGFFNFLSYQAIHRNQQQPPTDFMILNSTSFFERSLPKMQEYKSVHLYLDCDTTGQKFTQKALAIDPHKFHDERKLYQGYEDLNKWLVSIGQTNKNQLVQKR